MSPLQIGLSSWHRHWKQGQKQQHADVPCGDCTLCCRCWDAMPLTDEEAQSGIYASHVDAALNANVLNRQENGDCFYLQEGRCTIYAQRPQACRLFDCRVYQVLPLEWFAYVTPAVEALRDNAAERFQLVQKEPHDTTFHARLLHAAQVVSQHTHSTISASAVLHQMQP